jgi:alpha-glucosidase
MKKAFDLLTILFLIFTLHGCAGSEHDYVQVTSPNGEYRYVLQVENFRPVYTAYFNNNTIIKKSLMGIKFSNNKSQFQNVTIKSFAEREVDNTWKPVYGERNQYPEQYREVTVNFSSIEENKTAFQINIRAYNEGVAFRYELQETGKMVVESELTEFCMPMESELWFSKTAQGEIEKRNITELDTNVHFERPLLAKLNDSLFVALGEAALIDFGRMKFTLNKQKPATLVARLHSKVVYEDSFNTPWRVIMAGKTPGKLLENNYLFLNLNEPNKLPDFGWIKPGKIIREVTLTTQGGIACVDFAEKHNMQYIEFDAGWYGKEYEDSSDATTVTVDPTRSKGPLNLQKVIKYAESKGVGVILYVNRRALEKQIDELFPLFQKWGVAGVKFGFVNVGAQKSTKWLHEAVRKAANFKLMVDIHDEYRPTGYSRTYPNLMTQEGIRGDEESPDNRMVLKSLFVRMLAGAGDHTNCYFSERVGKKMGSHASQLAKAICIYSPWQFLYWYDRPVNSPKRTGGAGGNENYIIEVPELTFFDQLPTVWDATKVLEGYPGKYAVVARKKGTTWFIGALAGEQEKEVLIPVEFLDSDNTYEATIFTDNQSLGTPTNISIERQTITSKDVIKNRLKKNEGMAIIIKKSR